jgi:pimeloyl-ACP methyl ester carboxylesterase
LKWLSTLIKLILQVVIAAGIGLPIGVLKAMFMHIFCKDTVRQKQKIADKYAPLTQQALHELAQQINRGPAPVSRRIKLAKTDVEMHVILAGPEDGELVVLCHGFPECWYTWRHQIAPLANQGYRVAVPDMRGCGATSKPKGLKNYSMDPIAADIEQLITVGLGREKAHAVVGHDWGGVAAWSFAIRYPHRLNKLVTINAPHPGTFLPYMLTHPTQLLRSWYMFWFNVPYLPELVHGTDPLNFSEVILQTAHAKDAFTQFDKEILAAARAQPGALTGGLNWYRAILFSLALLPAYRKPILTPTLVLFGTRDHALEISMVEALKPKFVPNLQEVVKLEKCGHWTPSEARDKVNQRLVGFLTQ